MADTEEAPVFDPTVKKKKKTVTVLAPVEDGESPAAETPAADADGEGADADLFKGLKKKKAKKEEPAAEGEGDFDLGALKKKKKKKVTKTKDFDAELEKAGLLPSGEGEAPAQPEEEITPEDAGDIVQGTGVWSQSSNATLTYPLLLSRFFTQLKTQHPDLAGEGRTRSYKIPPPQVMREGNKKTIFANIADICKKMKRSDEHVTQYLFAELGTSGSVDGSRRLVIKGKFQQKQLENVLRRYIHEYVTCGTCKSPDTDLKKGENRLYFVTCNSCGSRRSVSAIKTGFQAHIGKRRRMVG